MPEAKNRKENGKPEEERNEATENEATENEVVETSLIVRFDKPFHFDKKEYTEVDLSGLENLTGNDMLEVERTLRLMGLTSALSDLSVMGIFTYAMMASGLPLEFFKDLPLREAKRVKTRILNFFW